MVWLLFQRASPWCGAKLLSQLYTGGFPEYTEKVEVKGSAGLCKSMVSCLSENTEEVNKADMASGTIMLGLMPTIISFIGPTVGEIALISARRPILAVLITLGAPSVYQARPFEFSSPGDSLKRDPGSFAMPKQNSSRATVITVAQYILLIMAVANCLINSVQLGTQTILSWKCLWSYLQLAWNFMPLATHVCAALSFRLSKVSNLCGFLSYKNAQQRFRLHFLQYVLSRRSTAANTIFVRVIATQSKGPLLEGTFPTL